MKFYFATNDKWYSKAHRYIAKEKSTHIGVGIFTESLNLVVDCTKPYGKLYHYKHWAKIYEVVDEIELPTHFGDDTLIYDDLIKACILTTYDWNAYYYAWIMGLRKFLFKTPYPKSNPWASDSGMWCTEIIRPLLPFLKSRGINIDYVDFAAQTPQMIFDLLAKKLEVIDANTKA